MHHSQNDIKLNELKLLKFNYGSNVFCVFFAVCSRKSEFDFFPENGRIELALMLEVSNSIAMQ